MKSRSILTLLSQCMMQNIHKWNKVMQSSDPPLQITPRAWGREASYLLASVHLEDKVRYCVYEKQSI